MEQKHDYSISLIRLIATVFIIVCHIMQYLDMELAWWFNVGVQMFLCMSGFLYGKRNQINDDLKFYKKNFLKILIDYYVVIISVILLFTIFLPEKLSIVEIIKVLLTNRTLRGGEHLWYIPYCLLCYLITPVLSRCLGNCENKSIFKRFLLLSIFVVVVIDLFFNYFKSAWIFCYILGFFLGRISNREKSDLCNKMSFAIITGAILSNCVQIIQDYVLKLEFSDIIASRYYRFCNFAHVALGVSLFIIFKAVFSVIFKNGYPNLIKKICGYSDKYSYDVYLVHQFVILGPFSLMHLTEMIGINLVLIMAIILVSSVLVNFISTRVRNKIMTVMNI